MYTIKIAEEFNETRYGIPFKRGIGETDNLELAQKLAAKGITVEDLPESGEKKKAKSLEKMNLEELKAYAAEKEIDLAGLTVKADILARIKELEAEGGEK